MLWLLLLLLLQIYLLLSLNKWTWVRFGVWLAIGACYCCGGNHHCFFSHMLCWLSLRVLVCDWQAW